MVYLRSTRDWIQPALMNVQQRLEQWYQQVIFKTSDTTFVEEIRSQFWQIENCKTLWKRWPIHMPRKAFRSICSVLILIKWSFLIERALTFLWPIYNCKVNRFRYKMAVFIWFLAENVLPTSWASWSSSQLVAVASQLKPFRVFQWLDVRKYLPLKSFFGGFRF